MNRAQKFTVSVSAIAAVGLGALALPMIGQIGQTVSSTVAGVDKMFSPATPGVAEADAAAAAAETVSSSTDVERNENDWLNRPKSHLSCERYTDHGESVFASGEILDTVGDQVLTYRVVEGDTLIGVMERFCTPSPAHLSVVVDGETYSAAAHFHPGVVLSVRHY